MRRRKKGDEAPPAQRSEPPSPSSQGRSQRRRQQQEEEEEEEEELRAEVVAANPAMESLLRRSRIADLKEQINGEAMSSQRNFIDVLAATSNEIKELEEQDNAELRAQLQHLKLSELRKRCARVHVDEDEVEETMDSGENPKEALIGILIVRLRELDEELQVLKLSVVKARVVDEGALTEDDTEAAAPVKQE